MGAPRDKQRGFVTVSYTHLDVYKRQSDEIKAVTGIYDASLGARGNETSMLAINSRK